MIGKIKKILGGPQKTHNKLYKIEIDNFEIKYLRSNSEIHVRKLNIEDCTQLVALRSENVKRAFEQMISNGEICVGAFVKGQLVAHESCTLPKQKTKSYIIEKSAFLHYAYVSPNYRGKNIYPMLIECMLKEIKELGKIKVVYTDTDANNLASQKGMLKAGFSYVEDVVTYSWWRIKWGRKRI